MDEVTLGTGSITWFFTLVHMPEIKMPPEPDGERKPQALPKAPPKDGSEKKVGPYFEVPKQPKQPKRGANWLWMAFALVGMVIVILPDDNGFLKYIWPKSPSLDRKEDAPAPGGGKLDISGAGHDPRRIRLLECTGVDPWKVKPAAWTPPKAEECDELRRVLNAEALAKEKGIPTSAASAVSAATAAGVVAVQRPDLLPPPGMASGEVLPSSRGPVGNKP
jgi:hypothetical protein